MKNEFYVGEGEGIYKQLVCRDSLNFRDLNWLSRLTFLTDLSCHLRTLSIQMQGKENLPELDEHTHHVFETKLRLWEERMHYTFHPFFKSSLFADLRIEFATRFKNLCAFTRTIRLFSSPIAVAIDDVPTDQQMELIELQCDDSLPAALNLLRTLRM